VTIARRYPWQGAERSTTHPFSAVRSIGVDRKADGECGYDYTVVLRLTGGRIVTLWGIRPPRGESERDIARFVSTDPDLEALRKLTRLRCEHRLD
jgi:hypothetical protein